MLRAEPTRSVRCGAGSPVEARPVPRPEEVGGDPPTVRRSHRRRPDARSPLLIGLVLVLLATVPVLVPLLVTRGGMHRHGRPARAGRRAGRAGAAPVRRRRGAGRHHWHRRAAPAAAAGRRPAPRRRIPRRPPPPPSSSPPPAPAPEPSARPARRPAPPPRRRSASPPSLTWWSSRCLVPGPAGHRPAGHLHRGGPQRRLRADPRGDPRRRLRRRRHAVPWSSAQSAPLAPGEQRTYTADGGVGGRLDRHRRRARAGGIVDDVDRIGETDNANNS